MGVTDKGLVKGTLQLGSTTNDCMNYRLEDCDQELDE